MLTFISCAKTMASHCSLKVPEVTVPYFEAEAVRNALEMSQVSAAELEKLLKVNAKIAAENKVRFHDFCSEDNHPMPQSVHIRELFSNASYQRILRLMTSVMHRNISVSPLFFTDCSVRWTVSDLIVWREMCACRRKAVLPCLIYWKPLLTDYFIEEIKKRGGILVNLASGEMKDLFDWKRVESEVRVVTPDFQVWKGGKLKTVVIYAKMCRGRWCVTSSKSHWMPRRFERFLVGRFYF